MNGLLIDVGGTWMRVGRTNGQRLVTHRRLPTPRSWRQAQRELVVVLSTIFAGEKIDRAVVGIPGVLDRQKTTLLVSPHLPAWVKQPIRRDLSFLIRAPVRLENDNALAALGEARYGAGRGHRLVAYLGLGTGVGGARIDDGRIDDRTDGFEPGHQYVDRGRTLEQLVGGQSLGRSGHINWRRVSRDLAHGLHNVAMMWSPDVIVLGGGVIENGRISWPVVRREYQRRMLFPHPPELLKSKLGQKAGLYGALGLVSTRT